MNYIAAFIAQAQSSKSSCDRGGDATSASVKTEGTRPGKTEVLSMRIDAKTRFQIEVLARVRGQRVSTVVERAIQEAADNVGWREYWHAEEGIRWIRMVSSQEEFNTAEDADKLEFTRHHWPFFYVTRECFPQ